MVIESTTPPTPGFESFRLTNSSITFTAGYSQISGAFTKIVSFRTFGDTVVTMRTEHEFTNIPRAQ